MPYGAESDRAEPKGPGPLDREASSVESLYDHIQRLSPQSESQRSLQNQTLTMALNLARTRVLLFEQLDLSMAVPLTVALVFWLCLIFASFGLFAPKTPPSSWLFLSALCRFPARYF